MTLNMKNNCCKTTVSQYFSVLLWLQLSNLRPIHICMKTNFVELLMAWNQLLHLFLIIIKFGVL